MTATTDKYEDAVAKLDYAENAVSNFSVLSYVSDEVEDGLNDILQTGSSNFPELDAALFEMQDDLENQNSETFVQHVMERTLSFDVPYAALSYYLVNNDKVLLEVFSPQSAAVRAGNLTFGEAFSQSASGPYYSTYGTELGSTGKLIMTMGVAIDVAGAVSEVLGSNDPVSEAGKQAWGLAGGLAGAALGEAAMANVVARLPIPPQSKAALGLVGIGTVAGYVGLEFLAENAFDDLFDDVLADANANGVLDIDELLPIAQGYVEDYINDLWNSTGTQAADLYDLLAATGENLGQDFLQLVDDYDWAFQNPGDVVNELPEWLQTPLELFGLAEIQASPLIIDLDGDGIEVTTLDQLTTTTFFDLTVDGFAEQSAWLQADQDGLLAIDSNQNGKIDDSSELFGTATIDGFAVLAELDSNNDLVIDENDAEWVNLLVWKDIDGDAISDDGELQSLSFYGIESISLGDVQNSNTDINGNFVSHVSAVSYSDGSVGSIADVWFSYDQTNTEFAGDYTLDLKTLFLPTLRGLGQVADLHIASSLDSGLLTKVDDFTTNWSVSEFGSGTLNSDITALLYDWAGVDGVAPNSRGSKVDAQELEFLEAFLGQDFTQRGYTDQPFANASHFIHHAFIDVYNALKAQLIFQAGGGILFTGDVVYNPFSGDFEGTKTFDSTAVNDLVADSTAMGVDTEAFWFEVLEYVSNVKSFDDFTTADETLFNTAIQNADAALSFAAIKADVEEATATGEEYEGSSDDDVITGTAGHDTISVGAGNDYVEAGSGHDVVNGGDGDDTLFGQENDDTLNGDAGNDFLYGQAGNDTLSGGLGGDVVHGGEGDDSYVFTGGDDFYYDSMGVDKIVLPTGIVLADLQFSRLGDHNMLITVGNLGSIELHNQIDYHSNYGVESIEFADTSTLAFTNLTQLATYGTNGDDSIAGIVSGATQNDIIYGLGGHDTINGGSGNDTIDGGLGNDTISTAGGDDTVIASAGYDVVNEYSGGNDTILIPAAYSASDVTVFRTVTDVGQDVIIQIDGLGQIELNRFFHHSNYHTEQISFEGGGASIDLLNHDYMVVGTSGNDNLSVASNPYSDNEIYVLGQGQDYVTDGAGTDHVLLGVGETLANVEVYKLDETAAFNTKNHLVVEDEDGNLIKFRQHFDAGPSNNDPYRLEYIELQDGTLIDTATLEIEVRGTEGDNNIDGIENGDLTNADVIYGYGGNDTIAAHSGDDTVYGGDGNDDVNGGDGSDTIYGGDGYDDLQGNDGDDTLYGEGGNDVLKGGIGHDVLDGDAGNDIVFGEDGDDTLQFTLSENSDSLSRYEGDKGDDTLEVYLTSAEYSVPLYNDLQAFRTFATNNLDTTSYTGAEYDFTYLGLSVSDVENLDVYVDGVLTTTAPNPGPMDPDAYDDVFYALQNTAVNGNVLNDNGNGADFDFNGDTLSVTVETKSTTQGGSVTINSDGSFTYTPATSFLGADTFTYTLNDGNSGTDTGTVTLNMSATAPPNFVIGTSNDENLTGVSSGDNYYNGKLGNDKLYGEDYDDIYFYDLGDGDDIIYERDGSDKILFGEGVTVNDVRFESSGNDLIVHIGDGQITVDDHFRSGWTKFVEIAEFSDASTIDLVNNLTFTGTNGNETVRGRSDNNIIVGAEGNDTLRGNEGDDSYVYNLGDGDDIILEHSGSADKIVFGSGITLNDLTFQKVGNYDLDIFIGDGKITIDDQFRTSYTKQVETAEFANGSSISLLNGLTFSGTSAAETISASNNDDVLEGLEGNDILNGNGDDDVLIGGEGDDTLKGGTDNDSYVYNLGDGDDLIDDHSGSADKIVFGSGITLNDLTFQTVGTYDLDIVIGDGKITIEDQFRTSYTNQIETAELSNGTIIDLLNNLTFTGTESAETLSGTNNDDTLKALGGNDTLNGNGGDDILDGGEGDDTLKGGYDNDTYIYNVGDGTDYIDDLNGTADKIAFGAGINEDNLVFRRSGYNLDIFTSGEKITIEYQYRSGYNQEIEEYSLSDGTTLSLLNNLTFTGTSSAETLSGSNNDDTLYGLEGADNLYGYSGADVFGFLESDLDGSHDAIKDFSTGDGDALDVSDLLEAYDPLNDAISDFVWLTNAGSHTDVYVDQDGTGTSEVWTKIATIENVTGLTDEAAQESNGTLITV